MRASTAARDGLPSDFCYSLALAPDGSFWIATSDGVRARRRAAASAPITARQGLADDMVHAVLVDARGTAWFGTASGLSRFERGRWRTYTRADGLTADEVVALGVGRDGTLWIGTRTGRRQSPASGGRFDSYTAADGLPDDFVHGSSRIAKATSGSASTRAASAGCEPRRSRRCRCATACPPTASAAVLEARDGSIWVGTNGYGLARVRKRHGHRLDARARGCRTARITAIAESRDGAMWIGTRLGVSRLKHGPRHARFTTADGLPQSDVRALLQDRARRASGSARSAASAA